MTFIGLNVNRRLLISLNFHKAPPSSFVFPQIVLEHLYTTQFLSLSPPSSQCKPSSRSIKIVVQSLRNSSPRLLPHLEMTAPSPLASLSFQPHLQQAVQLLCPLRWMTRRSWVFWRLKHSRWVLCLCYRLSTLLIQYLDVGLGGITTPLWGISLQGEDQTSSRSLRPAT